MRIGIVTAWYERGAAYVSRQLRDVLAREHEVFVYARGTEEAERIQNNDPSFRFPKGDPTWDAPYVTWGKSVPPFVTLALRLKFFKKWLRDWKLDLVLFNEQWLW